MPEAPKIPDIGKYRILELVGEGAMGVVYKAVDSVLDRTVAVKVMNESIARQDELRQRFLREAQAAASLQHPNVVSIYDLGEVGGHLYIAMEFVQGADLETLMQTGEPLSLQEKLDIIIDVLAGLTFAHKRGIVHRDIKPANIRIAEDGRAKLMDFGVAHLASSNLTSTGASLGTPVYMSPEQITGGKATASTDVFAVGAVLYELLTGLKPFDAETLQGLFYKILTEKPRPVRDLMPGLPSALDHIVEKAMAKEAPQRYQSALDMANDLSGVRAMLSGPGYPSSVSLSATVEHAIRKSKQAARVRLIRRELIAGGVLAAMVIAAVVWAQLSRSGSSGAAVARGTPAAAPAATESAAGASNGPETPPAASTPAATMARIDSVVERPAPAAPTTTARPAPKPERPAPTERVARTPSAASTRTANARSAPRQSAIGTARPPVTPPPTTVASAPPATTTQPSISQPTVQQGIAAPRPVPVAPAPAQQPPETTVAPTAPTAADVAPVIEAYARAIESRDLSAIRRVYPGLTSDQQRGFEQFFQSARKLNVSFRVASVDGTPSTAEVHVTGRYDYESSSGKAERQGVSFAATLRREGAGWRMVGLR
ncbi:MAG TPA: serine/threonine-protein kinase [Gemmatimonadaceae bacterium]|nr:serine/threonine-protein kinase [Gemmatimonadaceae bacterium]